MSNFSPSAPNRTLWIIAVIVGGVGILVHYFYVEGLSRYNYHMLLIGFVLLVIGTALRRF